MLTNQHGDVLIKKINNLPTILNKVYPKNGRFVLADGEVTGHAHAIVADNRLSVYESEASEWDNSNKLFMDVKEKVEIVHEEHHKQVIEPGIYEIGIVQEYDHFAEEARAVAD